MFLKIANNLKFFSLFTENYWPTIAQFVAYKFKLNFPILIFKACILQSVENCSEIGLEFRVIESSKKVENNGTTFYTTLGQLCKLSHKNICDFNSALLEFSRAKKFFPHFDTMREILFDMLNKSVKLHISQTFSVNLSPAQGIT